jgi:hypothetical protein
MHRRVERKDIREPSHISPQNPLEKKQEKWKQTKHKNSVVLLFKVNCEPHVLGRWGGWRDEGRPACTRDFLFPPWRTHSLE